LVIRLPEKRAAKTLVKRKNSNIKANAFVSAVV